jgi:hypothetical protein
MSEGLLGKGLTVANTDKPFYTAPADIKYATISVLVANTGAAEITVTISVASTTAPGAADIVDTGVLLVPGASLERSCIVVSPNETVFVKGNTATGAVRIHGLEKA